MPTKLTKEQILSMCQKSHPDKYLYDLNTLINTQTKFKIICKIHGEFWQTPANHIHLKQECPKCVNKNLLSNTSDFIKKANKIHNNKYNYLKVDYINNETKVCIICPEHGEFWQTPNNHLSKKHGCPKCKLIKLHQKFQKSQKQFITEANQCHNCFYDYSKVEYQSSHIKVCIICPEHGKFWQNPASHLKGRGCHKCKSSIGEKLIFKWLEQKSIKFIPQKRFIDCRDKYPLPFDFFLPDNNTCIEYDGELHFNSFRYKDVEIAQNKLLQTQLHDKIKNEYCLNNNIRLIRIPYWEKKNISFILRSKINGPII